MLICGAESRAGLVSIAKSVIKMPFPSPLVWGGFPALLVGQAGSVQSILPAQGSILPGGETSKTNIWMVVLLRKGFVMGLCGSAREGLLQLVLHQGGTNAAHVE